MKNTWSSQIQRWGQAAIDDTEIVVDNGERESLFSAVWESLSAKENQLPVKSRSLRLPARLYSSR